MHLTGFSFYILSGFLAIFPVLSSVGPDVLAIFLALSSVGPDVIDLEGGDPRLFVVLVDSSCHLQADGCDVGGV